MRIVGLTGGMGAGKTTVAAMFARLGWPVFDADATVHRLQGIGGAAVAPIAARWPHAVRDGAVDRTALRRAVIGAPGEIAALEAIVHPLVREGRTRFLQLARRRGAPVCVLDIPLLFETGADRICDTVVVVSAPLRTRLQRVMRRRSMTQAQALALISRQMDDTERRRRADIVIETGLSRAHTFAQVRRLRHDFLRTRDETVDSF